MDTIEPLVDKLIKPLRVEASLGCLNQAVIGGFDKYVLGWVERAGQDPSASSLKELFEPLKHLFHDYTDLSLADRKKRIDRAEALLSDFLLSTSGKEVEEKTQPTALQPPRKASHDSSSRTQNLSLLESPVQFAKGIGPKRAELLGKLGVRTLEDLLTYFPRDYDDRTQIRGVRQLRPGAKQSVCGTVSASGENERLRGKILTRVPLSDPTGTVYLTWWNQPFRKDQFKKGTQLLAFGKVSYFRHQANMDNPECEILDVKDPLQVGRIVPCYPLTQGLYQSSLRNAVYALLTQMDGHVEDVLPDSLLRKYGFLSFSQALQQIHFPESWSQKNQARRRLVFEEFLLLQLALALRKKQFKEDAPGISFQVERDRIQTLMKSLPFHLTEAQRRVLREIHQDMASTKAMCRLLHGDVGSGKTVVAGFCLLTAVNNGYQGTCMAPTEILAEQHFAVLESLLTPLGIRIELLTGSLSQREKSRIRQELENGDIPVIVGTHALIQEKVTFQRLGLVIVDEQHRFGVSQRLSLKQKGSNPDVLVMTATPIPRTLALTVYGDLDISVIDEMPPGRKPIITQWFKTKHSTEAYRFTRQQILLGRQAYVVCPLIEESEKLDYVKTATQVAERLQREVFPDFKVGLLHGRMNAAEKEQVMTAFRRGELQVLTSTTVIEVGVDVPNATVMMVEDSDRFGIAQLHQLRGRVGRGEHQSYCLLIGRPSTVEGRQRLQALVDTTDGFLIAEKDLELRGPGEFYGTRQHGLPDLKIANILEDVELLQQARREAFELVDNDSSLKQPQHQALAKKLNKLLGERLDRVAAS